MFCSFITRSPFHIETRPFPLFLKPAPGIISCNADNWGLADTRIWKSRYCYTTAQLAKKTLSHLQILCAGYKYTTLSSPSYRLQHMGFGPQLPKITYYGYRSRLQSVGIFFFLLLFLLGAGWGGAKKKWAQSILISYNGTSLIRLAFYLPVVQ